MKPETPLLQLTAREFAELLAWHARLATSGGFDQEREIRTLFGEPEPHQHEWEIGTALTHHGLKYRAKCDCGMREEGESAKALSDKLSTHGPGTIK